MNRTELAGKVAFELDMQPKEALKVIDKVFSLIMLDVADGNNVNVSGFGTFASVTRAPRIGRNPHTGEAVPIPERQGVKFVPGKRFKEVMG